MTDTVFCPSTFTVTPPRHHSPALGTTPFADVRWDHGAVPAPKRVRGVKRLGLLYERRVLDVLCAIYGRQCTPSPVIAYRDAAAGGVRRALPDALLYLGDQCIIIEVKLAHTVMVWNQLMERYAPLVRTIHPYLQVRTVEVCRSYDPAVPLPHTRITSLHSARHVPGLEVLKWRI